MDLPPSFSQTGAMKRVFVTGASSGIGLAIAQALVARGYEVWGTSRDPNRLPRSEHFHPVRLDLRDNNTIDGAFHTAWREAGHLDALINNAGSGHFGPAESLPFTEVTDQFQVLFFAHVRLMQLALAQMSSRDAGLIVNVTSLAARLPVPFMAAYNAGKAAMSVFTMTAQLELGQSRVRIVDLQPADICTEFNEAVRKIPSDPRYAETLRKTWETVDRNLKTAPKPALVAQKILDLLEDRNPPPRITVGGFFQAQIAPLFFRLLPQRVLIWGLKKYYGL
jgi:NAD(P)-dependent dehydrogenase (short-subunit alcohol dehydrogenase family)